MSINFMEAYKGVTKTVNYTRKNKCGTCDGARKRKGTDMYTCELCSSTGYVDDGLNYQICERCRGHGRIFDPCL